MVYLCLNYRGLFRDSSVCCLTFEETYFRDSVVTALILRYKFAAFTFCGGIANTTIKRHIL